MHQHELEAEAPQGHGTIQHGGSQDSGTVCARCAIGRERCPAALEGRPAQFPAPCQGVKPQGNATKAHSRVQTPVLRQTFACERWRV